MTMGTINEIFKTHLARYLKASKEQKGELLNHVCVITGMHRKAAVRKFRRLQLRDPHREERRGRSVYYTSDVTAALRYTWDISHELCAERLHAVIREYVSILRRDGSWKWNDKTTGKLLSMSIGTMKERISHFDRVLSGGGRAMTKPSDLKELIPVRRGPWQNPDPGYGEVDTVAHCGATAEGLFATTVQYTDIFLTWCFLEAQMGKGKKETVESIEAMERRSPFPLRGLDPDSGGEFINWNLYDWCKKKYIDLTRIRPGMKNDHGRIEQKNDKNVRKFAGYIRIDTEEKLRELKELLSVVEIYVNHFLPSMKCVEKVRKNVAHSSRKYDVPKTPYQRFMEHPKIAKQAQQKMKKFHGTLNPKTLHDEILRLRKQLFRNAKFTRSDV
jgi:hypothetical protein